MSSKYPEEKRFNVVISVNEEVLRAEREELGDSTPLELEDAIANEFGWLEKSGIDLEDIRVIPHSRRKTNKRSKS